MGAIVSQISESNKTNTNSVGIKVFLCLHLVHQSQAFMYDSAQIGQTILVRL
jgi:hypothetical protein